MARGFQVREILVHLHARLEVKLSKYDFHYQVGKQSFDYKPVNGFGKRLQLSVPRYASPQEPHPLLDWHDALSKNWYWVIGRVVPILATRSSTVFVAGVQ